MLQVTVAGNPELTTTARIGREGQIRLPLIGLVSVAGGALPRIAETISGLLANGYLVDPQVAVSVQEYRTLKATIIGMVNRTGVYEYREKLTFLELLSRAGGLSPDADRNAIVTSRTGEIRTVDLRGLLTLGNIALDIEIRDGDSVFVAAAGRFFITGEVQRPGAFICDRETNVLKAVALAGGFTDAAAKNKIRIVRRVEGQEQVREKVALEDLVFPDDILVIPKSFF